VAVVTEPSGEPLRLAFLLVPQFPLLPFSAAVEPLRAANRLSDRAVYAWELTSIDGRPVVASSGTALTVQSSLKDLARPDMLVVCAGLDPLQLAGDRTLRSRRRTLARQGTRIGAISGGSFILADAGLLTGRRCTVHWEYADLFRLHYPRLELTQDIYVVDGNVFTCSGGTAALDMMLHFIGEHCGFKLALAVADQFIHPRIREHGDHQRMDAHARYRLFNPKLAEVVRLMEGALGEPLNLQAITQRVGLSARQVERLFRHYIGVPPRKFHLQLRLRRSRTLILETPHAVRDVALECGFVSTSHFCNAYKRTFGRTPSEDRQHVGR
jgi:transcriptional regulator GlxA family with amidase domain